MRIPSSRKWVYACALAVAAIAAQPSPLYRASVRAQFGNDFLSQAEVGVGKLEVR